MESRVNQCWLPSPLCRDARHPLSDRSQPRASRTGGRPKAQNSEQNRVQKIMIRDKRRPKSLLKIAHCRPETAFVDTNQPPFERSHVGAAAFRGLARPRLDEALSAVGRSFAALGDAVNEHALSPADGLVGDLWTWSLRRRINEMSWSSSALVDREPVHGRP